MQGRQLHWRVLLPATMLCLAVLACGGFQLRGRATATPSPLSGTSRVARQVEPTMTATVPGVVPAPTLVPSPTPVPTAANTRGLGIGRTARIAASGGLNVRNKAGRLGRQVGKLDVGTVVTVRGGPSDADGYTWWQVDNGAGLTGWVAAGPADDPWLVSDKGVALTPAVGGGRLANRPIRVGDRVQVTTREGRMLTLREAAGKDARDLAHLLAGTVLAVRAGPEQMEGLTWWQVEDEQFSGWAADGDETERWLTPIDL